jgi:hypothetical protein
MAVSHFRAGIIPLASQVGLWLQNAHFRAGHFGLKSNQDVILNPDVSRPWIEIRKFRLSRAEELRSFLI